MIEKPDARELANALERANWAGAPIGNKLLLTAAIDVLRSAPPPSCSKCTRAEMCQDAGECAGTGYPLRKPA